MRRAAPDSTSRPGPGQQSSPHPPTPAAIAQKDPLCPSAARAAAVAFTVSVPGAGAAEETLPPPSAPRAPRLAAAPCHSAVAMFTEVRSGRGRGGKGCHVVWPGSVGWRAVLESQRWRVRVLPSARGSTPRSPPFPRLIRRDSSSVKSAVVWLSSRFCSP